MTEQEYREAWVEWMYMDLRVKWHQLETRLAALEPDAYQRVRDAWANDEWLLPPPWADDA